MPTIIREVKYSHCNFMCLTATPRIFITIPVSPFSIPGCNASCCVPVSFTTYTSRLWKKLVQTFATACHNTSEHMFTLCLQCVYRVFTGCLQYLYIILGRDEKSNDTLSATAAEWMFIYTNRTNCTFVLRNLLEIKAFKRIITFNSNKTK